MKWLTLVLSFVFVVLARIVFEVDLATAILVVLIVEAAWIAGELLTLRMKLDEELLPRLRVIQDEADRNYSSLREHVVGVRDAVEGLASAPSGPDGHVDDPAG